MGGTEEHLVQGWAEITDDSKRLNQKVGTILQGLGLRAPPSHPSIMNQPTPAGRNRQGRIPDLSYIMLWMLYAVGINSQGPYLDVMFGLGDYPCQGEIGIVVVFTVYYVIGPE